MSRVHLTVRYIEGLSATPKQQDHWDQTLLGLSLRVTPKGKKVFTLMYRFHGRQRRLNLGVFPAVSLADARKKAESAIGQLADDVDPAAERDALRQSETFGVLAADYLKHIKPGQTRTARKRSWAEDERLINKELLPILKPRKLSDIRRRDIQSLIQPLKNRGKGVMANHALSLIRTMFDFAIDMGMIESNPCARIRRPVEVHPRERYLNEDEIRTLWLALENRPSFVADILRMQLLTGQRVGEVFSMGWTDLDLQAGWWTIPAERAKNGHSHRVPLSASALHILEKRKLTATSAWVFPAPHDKKRFVGMPTLHKHVLHLRPIVDFRTHDLRKTVATNLSRAGASRIVLKRILNHRDGEVTARYDLYNYDSEAKCALEEWDSRLRQIVSTGKVIAFA